MGYYSGSTELFNWWLFDYLCFPAVLNIFRGMMEYWKMASFQYSINCYLSTLVFHVDDLKFSQFSSYFPLYRIARLIAQKGGANRGKD